MEHIDITKTFQEVGGQFLSPPELIASKLDAIKLVCFDWDGVFHDGRKSSSGESSFSEIDAVGVNLLRYAIYRKTGSIPKSVIMSEKSNPTAGAFARRESFDAFIFNADHRTLALGYFQEKYGVDPMEVLFVLDDMLDVKMALKCGLRFLVRNNAAPLFAAMAREMHAADYITGNTGGTGAVREISELILGLMGIYKKVMMEKIEHESHYDLYLQMRENTATQEVDFTTILAAQG